MPVIEPAIGGGFRIANPQVHRGGTGKGEPVAVEVVVDEEREHVNGVQNGSKDGG